MRRIKTGDNEERMGLINERQRIQWLDILRGFAILMVLLYHFTKRYGEKYPMQSFTDTVFLQINFGWIGVYLFFMISGFIIYLTIQRKRGPIDFLIARLSRLLPPYWAAIILILVLEYVHEQVFLVHNRNELVTTLLNFAMVPDIFHVRSLDGAFWSLYVELKFYVFFALLWKLINMKKHFVYYISFGILLLLANINNYIYALPLGKNFNYFLIFWVGIAACKVLNENMSVFMYLAIAAITTASTIGFYTDGPELILSIPIFSVLFLKSQSISERYPFVLSMFKPLSFLGRISYSLYLIHQPVGYIVLGILAGLTINCNLSVLTAIIICIGISWFGFKYVEQLNKPIALFITTIVSHVRTKRNGAF